MAIIIAISPDTIIRMIAPLEVLILEKRFANVPEKGAIADTHKDTRANVSEYSNGVNP